MYRRVVLACATSALVLVACDGGPGIRLTATALDPLREGLGCGASGCDQACTADGCDGGRRPPLAVVWTTAPVVAARAHLRDVDVPVLVDVLAGGAEATALAVRVPVSAGLALGDHELVLEVEGGDGSTASTDDDPLLTPTVLGLDELVLTGPPPPSATHLYSSIVVPTAIVAQLDGDVAVRLSSTSDIELAGIVSADATDAGPGPGGCAGLAHASDPRGCPGDGHGTAVEEGDAGGGSFGSAGGGGALAGDVTGNPMILPLGAFGPIGVPVTPDLDNRGHGGGAHGDDRGGHGGGGVLLWANGRIELGQYARVTARGGSAPRGAGASGGDGSGGAIIVSADAGITVAPAAAMPFDASGGRTGAVRGGDGRIRLDGAEDGFARAAPAPWSGPAWVDPPLVVGDPVQLTLRVDPRWQQEVRFTIEDRVVSCTPTAGTCRVTVEPAIGLTEVCAILGAGFSAPPGLIENGTCLRLARVE